MTRLPRTGQHLAATAAAGLLAITLAAQCSWHWTKAEQFRIAIPNGSERTPGLVRSGEGQHGRPLRSEIVEIEGRHRS
jgi:hypothetical protein